MHFAHRCPIGYDFASQNPDGGAAVNVIGLMLGFLRAVLLARAALVAENLALRRQLAVFQVSMKRAKLRKCDRLFWVWLSRLWSGWRSCLMIVKPETVIRWHRAGFWLHWRWKSREARSAEDRGGDPRAHSPDGAGEPALGRAADPVRVGAARLQRRRVDRGALHGSKRWPTIDSSWPLSGAKQGRGNSPVWTECVETAGAGHAGPAPAGVVKRDRHQPPVNSATKGLMSWKDG